MVVHHVAKLPGMMIHPVATAGEGAHVQLVDDHILEVRRHPAIIPPLVIRAPDDGVPHRAHLASRARVGTPEGLLVSDGELVAAPRPRAIDAALPVASHAGQRMGGIAPIVEGAGDRDTLGIGRPDPEDRTRTIDRGAELEGAQLGGVYEKVAVVRRTPGHPQAVVVVGIGTIGELEAVVDKAGFASLDDTPPDVKGTLVANPAHRVAAGLAIKGADPRCGEIPPEDAHLEREVLAGTGITR